MHYIHILSCTKLRFLPLLLMYINCNYFCTKLYLMTYFYLKSKALKKYKGVTYIALVLVNTSFFIFWKGEFTVNGDVSWKYLTLVVFTHELNSLSLQYKLFFCRTERIFCAEKFLFYLYCVELRQAHSICYIKSE